MRKIEYFGVGSVIDYHDRNKKSRNATVFEINIRVEKDYRSIMYVCEDDRGEMINIDGETFNQI